MSVSLYRLEISSPVTATNAAKTWTFTPSTNNTISLEIELKKDSQRLSVCTARIYDPQMEIFSALPDCAYNNVPIRVYLSKPANHQDVSHLVFEGKVTAMTSGFPEPTTLQVVGHDKSIDLRRRKRVRLFKGQSSVQIAQTIAAEYGFSVEVAVGTVTLGQTAIDWRPEVSDWDGIATALAADGLELFYDARRNKMVIRQSATATYPITLKRGGPEIVRIECTISHIRGPGQGGDKKMTLDVEATGEVRATTKLAVIESQAVEGASERTHRRPVKGPSTATAGAHSEDGGGSPWTNRITMDRKRKDSLTLTTIPLPDMGLHHLLNVSGFGAKIDGTWNIESIRYPVARDGMRTQVISCVRSSSAGGKKQGGNGGGLEPESITGV